MNKNCALCGKEFEKDKRTSIRHFSEMTKYCSRKCLDDSKLGNTYRRGKKHPNIWNKGKKGLQIAWNKGSDGEYAKKLGFGKWMLGKHHSEETKRKISEANKGIKSKSWKGIKAKYNSKHMWIYKQLGKPETCEHCGKTGLKKQQIHWANIDHKYKRNLNDWLRLCAKCHNSYDKKQILK